jgi:hypothetical protein
MHGYAAVIFHKRRSTKCRCRRSIKMSPLCKIEMTLSGGLWGEGGSADKRRRAFAARRAHSAGGGAATDAEGEAMQARHRTFDAMIAIDQP